MSALIEFQSVCKYYQMGDTTVKAADHISFQIQKGEFVAIVGQSGWMCQPPARICWTGRTWAR